MDRTFVILGSLTMLLGVATGAFGAHGLSGYFEQYPHLSATYDTAVQYLMVHGLALFISAWVVFRWPGALATGSGYLFLLGIVLFSGSLFVLVFTRTPWLGAITPLGGVAFLAGWLAIAIAAWRG